MKLLLVEGDPTLVERLTEFLTVHRCIVDVAGNETIALGMQQQRDYHVILLDAVLSDRGGVGLCRRLRQQGCTAPVVLLAVQANAETIIQYLEAGADDCITQPFDSMLFLARLRAWQRRHSQAFKDSALSWGELMLDPNQLRVTYRGQELHLSSKEYSLLELFLRNPQRIFTRDAILDQLWTLDHCPAPATVTNLVKDLRRKLKHAGMIKPPIRTVHGMGYQLVSPPAESEQSFSAASGDAEKPLPMSELNHIVDTFQKTLQERLVTIGAVANALKRDGLTAEIQQQARAAAHQLAGDLSGLGYGQGAYILRAIEHWLAKPVTLALAQADEFNHLLRRLHYILTQPPGFEPFASIPEVNFSDAAYKRLIFVP